MGILRDFWGIKMDNIEPSLAAHTYYPKKEQGRKIRSLKPASLK